MTEPPTPERAALLARLRLIAAGRSEPATPPEPEIPDDPSTEPNALSPAGLESIQRRVLDRLAGRAHSRQELARALAQRGCPEPAVTVVLDRLAAVGLIDDLAFARAWVEQRRQRKGLSLVQLGRELRAKGVSADIVEQVLEQSPESDQTVALELARSRLSRWSGLERPVWERRLAGLLSRRGFSPALVRQVVFQLRDETVE
ncbi:MAG: recombination regulator RecX [Propionibacteriaceae bacterium]|nr:recombination regulator RecX [Propionibacteriaceae bacterium]